MLNAIAEENKHFINYSIPFSGCFEMFNSKKREKTHELNWIETHTANARALRKISIWIRCDAKIELPLLQKKNLLTWHISRRRLQIDIICDCDKSSAQRDPTKSNKCNAAHCGHIYTQPYIDYRWPKVWAAFWIRNRSCKAAAATCNRRTNERTNREEKPQILWKWKPKATVVSKHKETPKVEMMRGKAMQCNEQ